MIKVKIFILILFMALGGLIVKGEDHSSKNSVLKGPYLGQDPPGLTPKVFAPGIISNGFHELGIVFSPAGDEIFYVMSDRNYKLYTIVTLKEKNNQWSSPEVASFSGQYTDNSLSISADGQNIYFRSKRPIPFSSPPSSDGNFWKVSRTPFGWGEPENPGSPVNTGKNETALCVAASGNLYFSASYSKGHGGDIYLARFQEGRYLPAEKIGGDISTSSGEGRPFIAPDESYLLFQSNRPGSFGQNDIYAAFRKKDGSWSRPVNLGKTVNTSYSEFAPYVTPDGRYLFFSSYKQLKPEDFKGKTYDELITLYRHPQNGYATLYWVDSQVVTRLKQDG